MNRRRGFTFVELLTVIGIISVLIMLLLPAVQASREIARRLMCEKNLMQLGIALGNYATSHGVLPPGVVNEKGPISNLPVGYHMGWAVQILPFIEQGNVYRHIDFTQGAYAAANTTAFSPVIASFLCPSDNRTRVMSYMGCHHDVEAPIDVDNHGVLFLNSRIAYDDIGDGLGYTILLGEARSSTTLGWGSGTRATLRNMGHLFDEPEPAMLVAVTRMNPDDENSQSYIASLVQSGAMPLYFVGGFSSRHAQGVNFLFCNGSTRFLRSTTDPSVLQRLAHRDDGFVIGDDAF